MSKKQSVFSRLRRLYSNNPGMVWAVGWVTVVPSLTSLIILNSLYGNPSFLGQFEFLTWSFVTYYTIASSLLMGLALLPTTFLAVLSGFVFGWISLPFLILGYTLATIIGYQIGKKLDKGSLDFLLENYPKAAQMIVDKRNKISQLIFFVRLSPVIPFALSNLLFALLKINLRKVVWMGLWGMLPRTFLAFTTGVVAESLVGALEENSGLRQWVIVGALLLISVLGIYRFFKR
ncbi:MAG TPA: VTT domain-containing protein [Cyclobacteriaceae bacterium]|nr:VTT domain-containing protein [Cyclobacteriaceae bacterium]